MVRVATTALVRGGNDYAYSIGWIDDWESHLNVSVAEWQFRSVGGLVCARLQQAG
jgi:hypothetical protein